MSVRYDVPRLAACGFAEIHAEILPGELKQCVNSTQLPAFVLDDLHRQDTVLVPQLDSLRSAENRHIFVPQRCGERWLPFNDYFPISYRDLALILLVNVINHDVLQHVAFIQTVLFDERRQLWVRLDPVADFVHINFLSVSPLLLHLQQKLLSDVRKARLINHSILRIHLSDVIRVSRGLVEIPWRVAKHFDRVRPAQRTCGEFELKRLLRRRLLGNLVDFQLRH